MGIIEDELSSTQLSDQTKVTVEYNEGDIIHIHIGRFRMDCSVEEFEELATSTKQAKEDLLSVKDGIQS